MPTRRLATLTGILFASLLLAPGALAQFTVTATSGPAPAPEAHIRVSWTPTGTAGELYEIRRTRLPSGTPQFLAVRPEADTTYQDTGALPGVDYRYCVTPATSATPEACATGSRDLRLPLTSQTDATDSTRTDGVALTWVDRSSVELGYVVFRGALTDPQTVAGLTAIDTTTADATGALDPTGIAGQRYRYCVGLLDGSGGVETVGEPLACDIGTRGVVAPPTGVAASDGTLADRVRVVWAARPGIEYTVYRQSATEPRAPLAMDLSASPYEDLTAVPLQAYTYCMTATTDAGESVPVCDAGQRGGLARPDSLVVSYDASDSAVELSWNDPGSTETGFRLYRQRSLPVGGPEELVAEVPANRTRYSDTGAVPGWTYDFSIEAIAVVTVDDAEVTTQSERRYGQNVGRRAELLPPTDFSASDTEDSAEDAVTLAWETESDVVQLFQVFRDGTPIATLAPFARGYEDATGLSGTTYTYHVRAVAVVDLDPALVKQGLAPLFTRAAAARTARAAERADARDAADHARLDARAEAEEATLIREIQDVLTGLGADASGLSDPARLGGSLVTRDSETDEGTRRLLAPDGLAATTDLEDRVRLTWTDRSEIERDYEIRAHYSPTDSVDVLVGPNRTEWVDIDAPAGVDVRYQIRTMDDEAGVSVSNWVEVTGRRDLLPPGRVRAAQQLVETELVVTWRDSSRAETGYEIAAALAGGLWVATTDPNARQVTVPIHPEDFGRGTTITVTAVDAETNRPSVLSRSETAAVAVIPTLLAPRVVTASTEYPDQVVISWTDDSAANDGYRILRGGIPLDSLGGTGTTYIDDSPAGPARYCVVPTRAGAPGAEPSLDPSEDCPRGRTFVAVVPGTGDVVSTVEVASDLDRLNPENSTRYGFAVAASGNTAIVSSWEDAVIDDYPDGHALPDWSIPHDGTPFDGGAVEDASSDGVGMVTIYERSADGWADTQRIQIEPGSGDDNRFTYGYFGWDVDIQGDVAIVGAPGPATFHIRPDLAGPGPITATWFFVDYTFSDGGAYVFHRDGDTGEWIRDLENMIRAPGLGGNQYPFYDSFLDMRTGTPLLDDGVSSIGSTQCSGTSCQLPAPPLQYTPSTSLLGQRVAITQDWAFASRIESGTPRVGAYRADQDYEHFTDLEVPAGFNTGGFRSLDATDGVVVMSSPTSNRVHLFALTATVSGTPDQIITSNANAQFGSTVDVDGDLLAVGGIDGAGAVYLYRKSSNGFTWGPDPEATFVPEGDDVGFGHNVTVEGDIVVVGALGPDGANEAVYTFRRQPDGEWQQVARLTREGASPGVATNFGHRNAIAGEDLVIGATNAEPDGRPTGAVYFATLPNPPTDVEASDGRYANRVQVRWEDRAQNEDGHRVYRRAPSDTEYALVGTVAPNVEVFDDFDISPGDAYSYCVVSFLGRDESDTNPLGESGRACDEGYTPPNGTISGRLATAEGAPVIGTGVCLAPGLDQAIMFDGLEGGAIVPDFGALPDAFTMEAWINADSYDGGDFGISSIAGIESQGNLAVLVTGDSDVPSETLQFTLWRNGEFTKLRGPLLEPGRWYHVAATYADRELALYLDGQQVDTATRANPIEDNVDGPFKIGQGLGRKPFDGRIDDVRVWSRALTPAEIEAAYTEPLRGDETDLYAYWAVDQGQGRILTDLTEGGRHADLQGGAEWTREGAPLNTCAESDGDGNYTFLGLRYGDEPTAFRVTPTDSTRQFTPGTRTATLTPESPTENQMDFTDTSAFTVRGTVVHAADQTLWPGQADLPGAEIEILVDGTVAATSESDGTFAVAVRGSGDHVIEARSESIPGLSFTATYDGQTFEDGTAELAVTRDLEDLVFTNTTSRELRGQAAGGCERPIGDLTFRLYTEDRLFDQTFTTDESVPYALLLPPLEYRLEYTGIGPVPGPLDRTAVVDYFRNLGVLSADLTTEADTTDFRYRAPIVLAIEGLTPPASACVSQGSYTVVDTDGNPRQSIPAVPVLAEYDRTPLTIRAYEDYGDGGTCPVDMGTVQIFDGFADAPEPITVELENGEAQYVTFGRSPDTFSGRTVAGIDRSYQKSLTAVLDVPDGPSVTETVWAVVEGYREKPATFVTATLSEFPVMILRDPPGTESSAYVEEGTSSCVALSEIRAVSDAVGFALDFKLGFKATIGFGFATDIGGAFHFSTQTVFGDEVTQTTGGPDSNIQVCGTTDERWETRGDTGWSGEDLYAGVGLNLIFAEADRVTVDGCSVELSAELATDLDEDDPFETTFVYGGTHIEQTLIPSLETLARLAGDIEIEGEVEGNEEVVSLRNAIQNWHGMLAVNDSLATAALSGEVENRSFSGGTSYSFGTSADTTWASQYAARSYISSDNRIGGIFTLNGYDSQNDAVIQYSSETTFARDSTNSTFYGTGYTLADSDAGDHFTVDVAQDPRYGTYVFNTLSGASSNPWEPNTQKRDLPQLAIDPPVRGGIPDGEAALYTLQLTNASESNERREYVLDVPPHLNASGAVVKLNGAVLSEKRVLIDANQTISFPITVERGPEADTSDVAIIAYSPFDHAIWRTAPQLGLVTADTARFQVSFVPSVAPVRLVEPEDGWAVTLDSASVQLSIGDLVLQGLPEETVGVEFRRGQGAWDTAFSQTGDQVTGSSIPFLWTPPEASGDGVYELRAFARRGGAAPAPPYFGPAVPGVIDRTAPRLFGLPEPADEVLALGEGIGLTFEEPIDCARLRRDLLADPSMAQLVASGAPTGLAVGCVENSIVLAPSDTSLWRVLEGQLVRARLRGVHDLAGNAMDAIDGADPGYDVSWRFTVRRNAFGWTPSTVTIRTQPMVPTDLPAALVNGRAQPVDYVLVPHNASGPAFTFTETTTGADIPVTTTPLAGTVVSGDVQPVVFRWPGTAPEGIYRSEIEVQGTEAGTALAPTTLVMTVEVSPDPPLWAVNPAAYETSMTVMAELQIYGVTSDDANDLLAAFVDGELRGVTSVKDTTVASTTYWRAPLTIYGSGAADRITFQAWDDDTSTLYTTTSRVLEFESDGIVGSVTMPFVIEAPGASGAPLEVPLNAGWTWISTNRQGTSPLSAALVGVGSSPNDQIKSQDLFAGYTPGNGAGTGWQGDLTGMEPGEGYRIFLAQSATMTHPGAPVNATQPLALDAGWNWIGYLPGTPMEVTDALASVTFESGDEIKSQVGYAQYTEGLGWFGTLEEMEAGPGYQLYVQSDAVLTYPAPPEALTKEAQLAAVSDDPLRPRPARRRDMIPVYANGMARRVRAPLRVDGQRPAALDKGTPTGITGFEHSMILTASLESGTDSLWVAAYALTSDGESLRGLAPVRHVDALGGPRAFLLIGGVSPDETVTLRAGRMGLDGTFVPDPAEVVFASGVPGSGLADPVRAEFTYLRDGSWGTPEAPVALGLSSATAGEDEALPSVVELAPTRPNPFSSTAVFSFALPAPSQVRLAIYDMLGREVAVLADDARSAGRHEIRFDGSRLASGSYVARLLAGSEVRVRSFVISR